MFSLSSETCIRSSSICLHVVAVASARRSAQDNAPDRVFRIEFVSGSHLRIENQFGDVEAEIWKENYVTVSATVAESKPLARSPVVIENRKQLLSISIVRRPTEPPLAIKLTVKIPESAHVEIVTGKHSISLRGTPSSASLRSIGGDVAVGFMGSPNADILARSVTGSVASTLPSFAPAAVTFCRRAWARAPKHCALTRKAARFHWL